MHRELARWLKDPDGLGAQLKTARIVAGITHVQLVDATGMTRQRISAAENGRQLPTPEEVDSWASACLAKASERRRMVKLAREGAELRQYWRIRESGGQRANQAGWTALHRSVDQVRGFSPWVIPSPFQTVEYAKGIIGLCSEESGDPRPAKDLEAAAIERLERYWMMLESTEKRYRYVITERVLDLDFTGVPGAMTAQLVRLHEAMLLDHVSIGIVPARVPPLTADRCEFVVYGERLVVVELPTEDVRYEPPGRDFYRYVELFDRIEGLAARSDEAVDLVRSRIQPDTSTRPATGVSSP